MLIDQMQLELKRVYHDGITVSEWFNKAELLCGKQKPHIILALAPFPYVSVKQSTIIHHKCDIARCIAPMVESGRCVRLLDLHFFFTHSIDAAVFALYWQNKRMSEHVNIH